MRGKFLSVLLCTSLLVLAPLSGRADSTWVGDPGKAWPVPNDAERGMHVQWFMDSFPGESISYLLDDELKKNIFVNPTCESASDERCSSNWLQFSALLPICADQVEPNCVEEFGVISQNGEKTKAEFSRNFPRRGQNAFVGDPRLELPSGATGALFNLPEAKHAGGSQYYLSVLSQGGVDKRIGATLGNFVIRLYPIALQPDSMIKSFDGPNIEAGWVENKTGGDGGKVGSWRQAGFGFSGNSFCVAGSSAENMCAQRYAFPAGIKFYVKVRTQLAPGGWMHGRIYNPDISLSKISGGYSLEVAAFPVSVPLVYKMYQYSVMPQQLKDQYDTVTGNYKPEVANWDPQRIADALKGGCGRSACTDSPLTRNKIVSPSPSDAYGMEQLNLWLPFLEDKATAQLGTWSMRTLDPGESVGAQRCFLDGSQGITGIVTTNATQYLAGPPKFNSSEQSLEYKVAAPHLTPKGEVFYGSYDLLMRSDVARCVYGFSNAPIKGTISITSDSGEQKIATEQIKESNGWVSLSANGFTYSQPTIRVKLSQDKVELPKEDPPMVATEAPKTTAVATNSQIVVPKKQSITCTKGKVTKKVVAVKPKCPTGYKKK